MSFRIGELFHVIHMSDALKPIDAWYDDVFYPRRGMLDENYSPAGKRDASLLVIADSIIETMAPADEEGAESMPSGRFFSRFGRHWHSIAWYVDDVGGVWDALMAAEIRTVADTFPPGVRPTEHAIYTHPKDSLVQLEFFQLPPSDLSGRNGTILPDPRLYPGWDSGWWADNHPLGLERLTSITVVTGNIDRAQRIFVDVLGGEPVDETESKLTGTRNLSVAIGARTVVELATPFDEDSLAAADLRSNGDSVHAMTYVVRDLDRAETYLASKGIGHIGRDDETLLADPDDTFGAPFRFTIS